jgi:ribosomal protein S18 acetylase RimI-like enzyme
MAITVRTMRDDDLPAILALQAQAYASAAFHPERAEVYVNRMALAPDYCLVAADGDGSLLGYLVSHPWDEGVPPALDTTLERLPAPASFWYLHDCAVHEKAHGRGVAGKLLAAGQTAARARGLAHGALVAVGDAAGYWRRHGYRRRELPGLAERLAKYGAGAVYMVCTL